nr:hypothetical protein [Bacillus yapensis]
MAMVKAWAVVVAQSHFGVASQVVGNSISVGIKIFSIVGGLDFGGDLCRVYAWQQQGGPSPLRLHMPRMLVAVLGRWRRRWILVEVIRGRGR